MPVPYRNGQSKMRNRKPNRLKTFDYSTGGYYFVTICTKDHDIWFGQIENGAMELNQYGQIAGKIWTAIPDHFENTELDQFVVMPNHIHGIVVINDGMVGNRHACSLQKRQHQTIPVIIGSYKSAVTKCIHQIKDGRNFHWQKSFFDHVIRDEKSFEAIREYIAHNPLKWDMDVENPGHFSVDSVTYYNRIIKAQGMVT